MIGLCKQLYFKVLILLVLGGMGELLLFPSFSRANNIRMADSKSSIVKVEESSSADSVWLSFFLQWDNSWRDDFNWDAAWIFFKYRKDSGNWTHVFPAVSGHQINSGFAYMPGMTAVNGSVLGLFIYRSGQASGNTPVLECRVKCARSALGNLTPQDFNEAKAFIQLQAVEMVYVPCGSYYAGDEVSYLTLSDVNGKSVFIGSDNESRALYTSGTSGVTLSTSYPQGYTGFYIMKYEVSQEQYVRFLNTLTYAQQQERVPGLTSMTSGEYIFGSRSKADNRNGIIVAQVPGNNQAVYFACNLIQDENYSQNGDGKTIACNYMSPEDMMAYCCWAGLRPMSEMEYEKASRTRAPETAVPQAYAWGSTTITSASGVTNGGYRNEQPTGGNANNKNSLGPVRCGSFAKSTSTQESAGATFWGVMEMSGNLKEMCYNINYTNFSATTFGTGEYAVNRWSTNTAHLGVRGGGFTSADSLLRVSDRTEAAVNYFSPITKRDSTVGFRGVYSLNNAAISQGSLVGTPATVCPGQTVMVGDDGTAIKETVNGVPVVHNSFTYEWSVQEPGATKKLITGANNAVLNYSNLTTPGNYVFYRKVTGLFASNEVSTTVTVPNVSLNVSPMEGNIDACGSATLFTTTVTGTANSYNWLKGTTSLSTDAGYQVKRSDFGNTQGDYIIKCEAVINGCKLTVDNIEVHIPEIKTSSNETVPVCGDYSFTDTRDGETYCTVKIGSQCWMGTNLRYFRSEWAVNSDYNYPNNSVTNKAAFGVLYSWSKTMTDYGNGTDICPQGWHVPSDTEWQTLEATIASNLGISINTNSTGWRGDGLGTAMKVAETVNGYTFCSGSSCNSSGFNVRAAGHGGSGFGVYTYFWSSPASGSSAWRRYLSYSNTTVRRNTTSKSHRFSVRCLRN